MGLDGFPDSRERKTDLSKEGGFECGGFTAKLASSNKSAERDISLGHLHLTAHEIARRLPENASLVIIDDFERISTAKERAQFADLVKKLSDNESRTTLMIVGIAENVDELLGAHESAQRNLVEIRVERLGNAEIREIINVGMDILGVQIGADEAEQIVEFSARFPYYTHLLCEGSVRSLLDRIEAGKRNDLKIEKDELSDSITFALRNAEHSISTTYDQAVRSLHESPRFKYSLYAIASWPEEPVAYGEISKWVGKLVHASQGYVNVSHQLKRLESLGVIQRVSPGYYKFKNPLLKAYVILKARADTADNELKAIDAQLNLVRRRLERLQERQQQTTDSNGPGGSVKS